MYDTTIDQGIEDKTQLSSEEKNDEGKGKEIIPSPSIKVKDLGKNIDDIELDKEILILN